MNYNKINQLKRQLDEEIEKQKQFQELSPTTKLAHILHGALCRHNHTDGCSWYYYDQRTKNNLNQEWFDMAEKLLPIIKHNLHPNENETDVQLFLRILGIINSCNVHELDEYKHVNL